MKEFRALCFLLVVVMLLSIGCARQSNDERISSINESGAVDAVNLGNGLYLIRASNDRWTKSLQKFVAEHPDLRITAIDAAIQSSHGADFEKIIITEPR